MDPKDVSNIIETVVLSVFGLGDGTGGPVAPATKEQ